MLGLNFFKTLPCVFYELFKGFRTLRIMGKYASRHLFRQSEPRNVPVSVSPSKEIGDSTRQRKNSPTSAGIEPTIFLYSGLHSLW